MPEGDVKTNCKEISFSSDNFVLKGTLHLPLNVCQPPVVIGSHGLFSDGGSPKHLALAEACNAFGIAYLRFDHRGCGQSEGVFKEVTTFDGRTHDLISAIETIKAMEELSPQIAIFGSSFGGAVCLSIAKKMRVRAVVTFAAPVSSAPIFKTYEKSGGAPSPEMEIDLPKLSFDITQKLKGLHHLLIFHGDSDKVISSSEAHKIYQYAVMPKRLIMLKNGDHRMSLKENQEKFVREASLWFKAALIETHYPQ
jgi:alpha-beta hydrolase superfamily lysophospholipase